MTDDFTVCRDTFRWWNSSWRILRVVAVACAAIVLWGCGTGDAEEADDATPTTATAAPETAPPTTAASTTAAPETAPPTTAATTTAAPDTALPTTAASATGGAASGNFVEQIFSYARSVYDGNGIDGLAALGSRFMNPAESFMFVIDAEGTIVYHPNDALVGESIHGDLGVDAYGYPWAERLMQAPADGSFHGTAWMNPLGSHNAVNVFEGEGDPPSGSTVFDDLRNDRLYFRGAVTVQHDGLFFTVVIPERSANDANRGMIAMSASLIEQGDDLEMVGDLVTISENAFLALQHIGHWHADNTTTGERFVGFLADADGVIVDSRFDPATEGSLIADVLDADTLSHATADGARYVNADQGIDVHLISTSNGFVVGVGITRN